MQNEAALKHPLRPLLPRRVVLKRAMLAFLLFLVNGSHLRRRRKVELEIRPPVGGQWPRPAGHPWQEKLPHSRAGSWLKEASEGGGLREEQRRRTGKNFPVPPLKPAKIAHLPSFKAEFMGRIWPSVFGTIFASHRAMTTTVQRRKTVTTTERRETEPPPAVAPGSWEFMFRMLVVFQRTHGHCEVPESSVAGSLGHWLAAQHQAAWHGQLSLEHQTRLEELGVVFGRQESGEAARERRWQEMYAQLLAYKEAHGDCKVPTKYPENPKLGNWVSNQRQLFSRDALKSAHRELLTQIGFVFKSKVGWRDPLVRWEKHFAELNEFHRGHGHCEPPADHPVRPWVYQQRYQRSAGRLSEEQIRRLDEIGFSWEGIRAPQVRQLWEEHFNELLAFQQEHGHCEPEEDHALHLWVQYQRAQRSAGQLAEERIRRLDEIHFPWHGMKAARRWEQRFAQLVEFHRAQGHCRIPIHWPDDPTLATWLAMQRQRLHRGKLTKDRAERLLALGVQPASRDLLWKTRYDELVAYHALHGHCSVPLDWQGSRCLSLWVATQRRLFRQGRLATEHKGLLDRLQFPWSLPGTVTFTQDRIWRTMVAALKGFREAHGHALPNRSIPEQRRLADWCHRTRNKWKAGHLDPAGEEELRGAGFAFDVEEAGWELNLRRLMDWKRTHGHCRIPQKHPEHGSLSHWTTTQRTLHRRGQLSECRIRRLEEIGFDWEPKAESWDNYFARLCAFHREHGHCTIPSKTPELSGLYAWVSLQRRRRKAGKLKASRIARLDSLGFNWRGRVTLDWEENFARLRQFKELHGHCHVLHTQDGALRKWVTYQRRQQAAGRLPAEKCARLDALDRTWSAVETTDRAQTPIEAPPKVAP
jgi:hypothetical protein